MKLDLSFAGLIATDSSAGAAPPAPAHPLQQYFGSGAIASVM